MCVSKADGTRSTGSIDWPRQQCARSKPLSVSTRRPRSVDSITRKIDPSRLHCIATRSKPPSQRTPHHTRPSTAHTRTHTGRAALLQKHVALPAASRVYAHAVRQRRGFASLPDHTVVGLPALSPTMTHGNLAQWHKKVCVCVGVGARIGGWGGDDCVLYIAWVRGRFGSRVEVGSRTRGRHI